MRAKNRAEHSFSAEVLLPLIFFSKTQIIYVIPVIFLAVGTLLIFLELLRLQPRSTTSAVYIFGLAVLGGAGWTCAELPPYWIWSVHMLIPCAAWKPTDMQRAKPRLFGFKKYSKRRIQELVRALFFFGIGSGALFFICENFQGVASWIFAIAALLFFEIIFSKIKGRQK